jgi:rhodanese-related sulfurtransferase
MHQSLGRIANAQLIPLHELKAPLAEIASDKLIVADRHAGMRPRQPTLILRGGGLARCANLRGGMLLWSRLGQPTSQSQVGTGECTE